MLPGRARSSLDWRLVSGPARAREASAQGAVQRHVADRRQHIEFSISIFCSRCPTSIVPASGGGSRTLLSSLESLAIELDGAGSRPSASYFSTSRATSRPTGRTTLRAGPCRPSCVATGRIPTAGDWASAGGSHHWPVESSFFRRRVRDRGVARFDPRAGRSSMRSSIQGTFGARFTLTGIATVSHGLVYADPAVDLGPTRARAPWRRTRRATRWASRPPPKRTRAGSTSRGLAS